jgi:hypothetical protein
MSRTPATKLEGSNGHARRIAAGGVYHGSATNLFLRGKRGLSQSKLVRALLAEAKAQELDYALIIRSLDDSAITAAPELSTREFLHLYKSTDLEAPPIALLAYRVYPDGREELVRGVQLKPVSLRSWRHVIATGNKPVAVNFLASSEHPLTHKFQGVGEGAVPSTGVESAIVTPSLLFRELDVTGTAAGRRALPLVPRPGAEASP